MEERDAIAAAARLALLGTSAELAVPFEELKPEIRERWRGVVRAVQGPSFKCQECADRHEAMMKPQPEVRCAGCLEKDNKIHSLRQYYSDVQSKINDLRTALGDE